MSRPVLMDSFGGPEKLAVHDVPEPHAGAGQVRVRVTAAGLNPMDWIMTANDEAGARFGLSLPVGFGTDYAGVVDEVGDKVIGFKVGDRVFGCALSRSVADYVVVDPGGTIGDGAHHTPDGVDDQIAATLDIAARELGVPDDRISTIAARVDGVTAVSGAQAPPGILEHVAELVATGQLVVPIAATYPVEQIRAAAELQAGRHAHGKVVVTL